MGRLLEGLKKGLKEGSQTRMIRRAQLAEVKQKHKEVFAEAYAKASVEEIKRKARMEASQQFRTTSEKTQDLFKAFGGLSGTKPKKKLTESERIKREVKRQLGTKATGLSESEKIKREVRRQTGARVRKKTHKKAHDPFDINLDLGFDF